MPRASAASLPPGQLPAVEMRLLGGFAVLIDGQPLPDRAWGGSRKARALAKLLALAPGQRLHRDQAIDALWPDLDPDAAGRALHQTLYLIRRALAPAQAQVALQDQVVVLHAPGGLTTDLAAFQAAANHARRSRAHTDCEVALARYTGDLLPDDRYEEWAVQPREAARTTHLALLRDLAASQEADHDPDGAIATLERLVAAEPSDEAAHVALMRLHAQSGQRAQALQQFGLLRAALKRDLDAEPEPASQQLYAAILAGRFTEVGSQKSEVGSGEGARERHNLPAPTTDLIGREAAIAAIRRELASARLVTLLGTGGIGKTRLALAAGHALLAEYPGGVWLLDLAALQDGALLDGTLAGVLGVRERAGQPLRETVSAALRGRPALIVLDNCEHLIDACADLADALLAVCPELRLLATSREALRVAGELTWRVPSLPVPELPTGNGSASPPRDLAANPAVRLFLDRARFARPSFALTTENATAVATICRRLDGIPLAIELAAARVAVLAPQQLAARLDDALRVLTGGPRTALPRHQTLRATLDWSYQFLAAPEQTLLDRLSVFAGGCTLATAEAVGSGPWTVGRGQWTGDSGQSSVSSPLSTDTLGTLAALVDKSLVQVELGQGEEEPRYRLLETVRQFAAERLTTSGEAERYRERHAAYFLHLAETAEPRLYGEHQARWIAHLTRDLDNLRAALAWYAAHDLVAEELRLASALERFWMQGVLYTEGLARLDDALARAAAVAPRVRANALYVAAALATHLDGDRGTARAEASLALYRDLGDRSGQAEVRNILGVAARLRGDARQSRAHLEEAVALNRADNDTKGTVMALANLGNLLFDQGDPDAAIATYEEILPLARPLADMSLLGMMLGNLSLGYASVGRFAEVPATLGEAIRLLASLDRWFHLQIALITLAFFAAERGDASVAAQCLGASAKLLTVAGLVQVPIQAHFTDRATAAARAALGEAAFTAAYATGYAWSTGESVAQALAYLAD